MTDPYEQAERYGVRYEGELVGAEYHETVAGYDQALTLAEVKQAGGRLTRVRLLGDAGPGGLVDVSYVHATLPDGRIVPVCNLPGNIGTRMTWKRGLVEWAQREGVNGKALGMFDAISALWG